MDAKVDAALRHGTEEPSIHELLVEFEGAVFNRVQASNRDYAGWEECAGRADSLRRQILARLTALTADLDVAREIAEWAMARVGGVGWDGATAWHECQYCGQVDADDTDAIPHSGDCPYLTRLDKLGTLAARSVPNAAAPAPEDQP